MAGFSLLMLYPWQITVDELEEILTTQKDGPIVHLEDSQAKFIKMNEKDRLQHLKKLVEFEEESMEVEKETTWSWRKLLNSVFGLENEKKRREKTGKSPKTCNIYKKSPDFRNNYGSSIALEDTNCDPLKHSGVGVYHVNLTAVLFFLQFSFVNV